MWHPLFTVRKKISKGLDTWLGLLAMAIVLGIWCLLTYGRYVQPLFFPSPTDILEATKDLAQRGLLLGSIGISLWRIGQAMLITLSIGISLGLALGCFPVLDSLAHRFIDGLKSVPPTGYLALLILWFGIEEKQKVAFLVFGTVFYMILMTKQAAVNVREEYVTVAIDLGATPWQMLTRVILPGALPQIWDAIIVCNGVMWTYVVLAEYVNAQSGLGYLMQQGGRLNRTPEVFVGMIIIALISTLTDWILRKVKARFFNW